tara:strand:+ start:66 stop:788 length:723 start_codon:yes stop_codon:yes gene_type:complete
MNKDRLAILYNESGKKFRDSRVGKLVKSAITSDTTKRLRDIAIDKIGAKEHEKRFIQHLSGGTVGNKPITELPEKLLTGLSISHARGSYPNKRELINNPDNPEGLSDLGPQKVPNPNYNPNSTLLSTYAMGAETAHTLGHVQMTSNKDGSFQMTDTYNVDSNVSMGDEKYTPLVGERSDLVEGTKHIELFGKKFQIPVASRMHDVSTWLGVSQDMQFDVKIPKSQIDEAKKMYSYRNNLK